MSVRFDTSPFVQRSQGGIVGWLSPQFGEQVTIWGFDQVPDLPARSSDERALYRDLAVKAAEVGCLIEASVTTIGGVLAVYQLVKLPLPDAPAGQAFVGTFILPKTDRSVVVKVQSLEQGTTGLREAVLMNQVGFERWVMPHPYAPELNGRLPFHAGDDPRYDTSFPEHPLTRVRACLQHVARTAEVDPGFAALPPFALFAT